jgi:2-polyprenyl-6-methoxyphenol hydroxylase-like FAD-dependent oxidoreductase
MADSEYEKPRIVIIGAGATGLAVAEMMKGVADVTVLHSAAELYELGDEPEVVTVDSIAELQELGTGPVLQYARIDSFRLIESPAQAAPSDYDHRGGKGRGRGRADWNKVNRGY